MFIKRLQILPGKFRIFVVLFITCVHILPIFYVMIGLASQADPVVKYFPLHPGAGFIHRDSSLSVTDLGQGKYRVRLDTVSKTSDTAKLRQDVTLLYQDGILVDFSYNWQENADTLIQQLEIISNYNHRYEAITFHYGEFHEGDVITSAQDMSYDFLYVIASRYSNLDEFRLTKTPQQETWKKTIDQSIYQQLIFEWNNAAKIFNLNYKDYYLIPLSQLYQYMHREKLPGIKNHDKTEVIGKLWEDLYYQYVLGYTGKESPPVDPIGSSMPLILVKKDGTRVHTIFRTKNGLYHQVTQKVE